MTYQYLKLEPEGTLATVTISREQALNALNRDLLTEITECFSKLSGDRGLRAILLTGAGEKAFVAGADIAAMQEMNPAEASEFSRLGHEAMNQVEKCRIPVIAVVNGFCLGGGMELALACDFIYASERAKLGLPEVGLGLFPGWGGTQRLTRLVGKNRAKEIIFSGRMWSAEAAAQWGIVNRVCKPEELMTVARGVAEEIAKKGPVAVALAKRLINETCNTPLVEGLQNERHTFSECFKTEDLKEGLAAFLEKRPALFKGK